MPYVAQGTIQPIWKTFRSERRLQLKKTLRLRTFSKLAELFLALQQKAHSNLQYHQTQECLMMAYRPNTACIPWPLCPKHCSKTPQRPSTMIRMVNVCCRGDGKKGASVYMCVQCGHGCGVCRQATCGLSNFKPTSRAYCTPTPHNTRA